MKLVIGLVAGASALCLASSALAAPLPPIPTVEGSIAVNTVKSEHRAAFVAAFLAYARSTPPSKAVAYGVCTTRDNDTDLYTYFQFASFEDNFTSVRTPISADFIALREVKWRANYKPLVNPASSNIFGKTVHNFFVFSVPSKNIESFVRAALKSNSQILPNDPGNVPAFVSQNAAGGGTNAVNQLNVHFVNSDNKNLGIGIDNYFKGGKDAAFFDALVD